MFRSIFSYSLAITFLMFSACKSKSVIPEEEIVIGVKFEKNKKIGEVLDQAADMNKLVFVDVYADWCLPCQMMDEDVFSDRGIGDFMNEHFVNYKVDTERGEGPDLSVLFNVQVLPTLLFLDSKGKVLVRKEGAAYHTELRRLANEALLQEQPGE